MTNEFYLALFNETTWTDFQKSGGNIYGTTKNKENRAQKLQPGDKLICYISQLSVFAGVLEIASPSFLDHSDIWSGADFPVRCKVKTNVALDPQPEISVRDYFNKLTIFSHLKNEKSWAGFFLNTLNRFPKEDGEKIMNDLLGKGKTKKWSYSFTSHTPPVHPQNPPGKPHTYSHNISPESGRL